MENNIEVNAYYYDKHYKDLVRIEAIGITGIVFRVIEDPNGHWHHPVVVWSERKFNSFPYIKVRNKEELEFIKAIYE